MKIEITTPTNIAITIDTGNTNSLSSLRDAIEKALELEGYTKEDIDEVFNREQDVKKGVSMEAKEPYKDFIVGMAYRCIDELLVSFTPNKWYECVELNNRSVFFINDCGDKIPLTKETATAYFDIANPVQDLYKQLGGKGKLESITIEKKYSEAQEVLKSMADIAETHEYEALAEQIINGPKVELQGTLTEDGKYFYPTTDDGSLLKDCRHHKHNVSCYGQTVKIGSYACTKCIFNQGVDSEADWIKCSKIKEVLGEENS